MERLKVKEMPPEQHSRGTMGLFRSFVFLLMLYLPQGSNTSLVRLNNNGYEGIIIAIDPTVPENETLIEKIQVRK